MVTDSLNLRLLRLCCAVFVLATMMAATVSAAVNMAPGARLTVSPVAGEAMVSGHGSHQAHSAAMSRAGPSSAPLSSAAHICCVLSQLLVTPMSQPVLDHPSARTAPLVPAPGEVEAGLTPSIPVPPPRTV